MWGSGDRASPFSTSTQCNGSEWWVSHPERFTSGEIDWYPLHRELVGPHNMSTLWRREKFCPADEKIKKKWNSKNVREDVIPSLSESRMLKEIFRPEKEEVTGGRRKFNNGKLQNVYSSPNIRITKSQKMGWAGRLERVVPKSMGTDFGMKDRW